MVIIDEIRPSTRLTSVPDMITGSCRSQIYWYIKYRKESFGIDKAELVYASLAGNDAVADTTCQAARLKLTFMRRTP